MCMHNAEVVLQFTIIFINMIYATQVYPTIKTVWTERANKFTKFW